MSLFDAPEFSSACFNRNMSLLGSGNFGFEPKPPHLTSKIDLMSERTSKAVSLPIRPPCLSFAQERTESLSRIISAKSSAAFSTSLRCMSHSHFILGRISVMPGICPVVRLGSQVVQKNGRPSGVIKIFRGQPALPFCTLQISMQRLSIAGYSSLSTSTGTQISFIMPATS